ncbi:hypothetical protein DL764_000586 [Monosporascus ibericus]|uniref:Uncharacterized protein n=1 Tax=Monosporascus ibericus TaxID=155417 RepID=A0A4Q4TY21_9PEZI|nr:hypothetical protein DL764_000586 [Monosporascus ibericus]
MGRATDGSFKVPDPNDRGGHQQTVAIEEELNLARNKVPAEAPPPYEEAASSAANTNTNTNTTTDANATATANTTANAKDKPKANTDVAASSTQENQEPTQNVSSASGRACGGGATGTPCRVSRKPREDKEGYKKQDPMSPYVPDDEAKWKAKRGEPGYFCSTGGGYFCSTRGGVCCSDRGGWFCSDREGWFCSDSKGCCCASKGGACC